MSNFVIFLVFLVLLVELVSIAIAIYMAKEKGLDIWYGVVWGFIPLLGQLIVAFMPMSNRSLVDTLYDRDLITKEEYDKTVEINDLDKFIVKKKKSKKQAAKK